MDSRPSGRRALRLAVILATSSLAVLSGAGIAPALPAISAHFHEAPSADFLVRLMLTAPALFIALCAVPAGTAIDRIGRRPTLVFSLALFGAAGGAGLILDSLYALLVSRALLGVAVAGSMTCATALVADGFQGSQRNRILGLQGAAMSLGGLVFLAGGGVLSDWHWRGPFALYLLAFLVLPAALAVVAEPPPRTSGDQESERLRADASRNRLLYAAAFLGMAAFYMVPVHLAFHLVERFNASNTMSGLALACSTVFSALMAANYRRMHAWLGFRGVCVWVYGGMGISFIVLWQSGSYGMVLVSMVILGSSLGMFSPNLVMKLMETTPEGLRGRALGGLTSAIFLGQFATPILSKPLVAHVGIAGAIGVTGVLLLCLTPAFLVVGRRRIGPVASKGAGGA